MQPDNPLLMQPDDTALQPENTVPQAVNSPLKIAYLTAGAAGMICGSCMHDNTLARALIALGHDVQLIPLAGFEVDTNRAILLDSFGASEETPVLTKAGLADVILDRVAVLLGRAPAIPDQEMR